MTGLVLVQDGFALLGALAAVAFVLLYALRAAWWRNPVGRFLIVQGTVIGLLYVSSVIRLARNGWIPIVPASVGTFLVTVIAASMEIGGVAAIVVVMRQSRHLTHLAVGADHDLHGRVAAALANAATITEDDIITGRVDRLASAVITALARST